MLKLGLWIGMPSLVAYVASPHALKLESTLFIFAVAVLAVAVGIIPRLDGKLRR